MCEQRHVGRVAICLLLAVSLCFSPAFSEESATSEENTQLDQLESLDLQLELSSDFAFVPYEVALNTWKLKNEWKEIALQEKEQAKTLLDVNISLRKENEKLLRQRKILTITSAILVGGLLGTILITSLGGQYEN